MMLLGVLAILATLQASHAPIPLEIRAPEYPEVALRARQQGKVEVDVTIDSDGRVSAARVSKSVAASLDAVSVAVVREWRFNTDSTTGVREATVCFIFEIDHDHPWSGAWWIGPPVITVLVPEMTVRIQERLNLSEKLAAPR